MRQQMPSCSHTSSRFTYNDALPISSNASRRPPRWARPTNTFQLTASSLLSFPSRHDSPLSSLTARIRKERRCRELERSEEHTSKLQSQSNFVCHLLRDKQKKKISTY